MTRDLFTIAKRHHGGQAADVIRGGSLLVFVGLQFGKHHLLQWVFAKIILLVAAISASIKAFNPQATSIQSKAGIFIAALAYVGIVVLAVVKPDNLF